MAAKDMRAASRPEVPDPYRCVRRAADERVLRRRQAPHAALVLLQDVDEAAGAGGVDADRLVVRRGDDAPMGDQEAGHDGMAVCRQGEMF